MKQKSTFAGSDVCVVLDVDVFDVFSLLCTPLLKGSVELRHVPLNLGCNVKFHGFRTFAEAEGNYKQKQTVGNAKALG